MAAPRSTSLRALRALSQQHATAPSSSFRRSLHITGAFSAQPANPADKTSLYAARSLADLKAECQRRSLRTTGSKNELIDRLSNHDLLRSRAFSIAMRRIDGNAFGGSSNTRKFNTSRAHKAVKDSSTMDFVYMPSMAEVEPPSPFPGIRVPILPDSQAYVDRAPTHPPSPMKPQIHAVSELASDVSASPLSEVVDNHSVPIDPFSLTEAVGRSRSGAMQRQREAEQSAAEEKGVFRELWSGFVEDLLGPSPKGSNAARK